LSHVRVLWLKFHEALLQADMVAAERIRERGHGCGGRLHRADYPRKARGLDESPEVLDYLQQRQCRVVFVPPYSPDTNPIEMAFSKIKHHVRKAFAQSTRALREAFDAACATIRPRDARNYIRHAGYY